LTQFSFSKDKRILKRKDFIRLSKQGKKVFTDYFIAIVTQGAENNNRIGITASKKVGNAPERNRIKRLIRENFRHRENNNLVTKDINIIARKGIVSLSNKEINTELNRLFNKITKLY
jgi:ribonuclease P protein component